MDRHAFILFCAFLTFPEPILITNVVTVTINSLGHYLDFGHTTRDEYIGLVWNRGEFSLFLRFSCEIERIPLKFLRDLCEIPAFQTKP